MTSQLSSAVFKLKPVNCILKLRASCYVLQNRIESLFPLASATNLRFLTVAGNKLTSTRGLERLTKLLFLDVSDNLIASLNPGEQLLSNLRSSLEARSEGLQALCQLCLELGCQGQEAECVSNNWPVPLRLLEETNGLHQGPRWWVSQYAPQVPSL